MTIELNLTMVICVASCIVTIGGAVKILSELKKAMEHPLEETNKRVDHCEKCLDNDNRHFQKIDTAIEELGQATNLLVSSNVAMMSHMIYGNHVENLKEEKKHMEEWLVSRKDYRI